MNPAQMKHEIGGTDDGNTEACIKLVGKIRQCLTVETSCQPANKYSLDCFINSKFIINCNEQVKFVATNN